MIALTIENTPFVLHSSLGLLSLVTECNYVLHVLFIMGHVNHKSFLRSCDL
jgi:hypothetical protein